MQRSGEWREEHTQGDLICLVLAVSMADGRPRVQVRVSSKKCQAPAPSRIQYSFDRSVIKTGLRVLGTRSKHVVAVKGLAVEPFLPGIAAWEGGRLSFILAANMADGTQRVVQVGRSKLINVF